MHLSSEKEKFVEEPRSRAGEDRIMGIAPEWQFSLFGTIVCSLECFPFKSSFLKFAGKRVVILVFG